MPHEKTNTNAVILRIEGNNITAEKFSNSVRTFFEIIEDVAANVTGKSRGIEWIISVEPGSIGLCATAKAVEVSAREVARTVNTITKGIESIGKRKKPPKYFSQNTLERLYHLGNIVGLRENGVSQIFIQTNGKPYEISPSSVAFVSEILKTPTMAYGTIEGHLLALELKGRVRFGIDEVLTGRRVKCFFGDEIYSDVIKAIRKRVSAYGLIRYRKSGIPASVEIKELNVFPEQGKLPQFEDLIGLYRE
ncbi:MAG: hypothetical protein A2Z25_19140 [Planctomycetes bacterium RBG_16_55_9]|nr:MAG: hypothetical protein A2Z25_19140 [Planctomycetes bacterium RBG_16_55_9]